MTPADFKTIIEEISMSWPTKSGWATEMQKPGDRHKREAAHVYARWRHFTADTMRKAIADIERESPRILPPPPAFAARAAELANTDDNDGTNQLLAGAHCDAAGHVWATTADWILTEARSNRGRVTVRCARCSHDAEFAAQRLWAANHYDATHGPLPQELHAGGNPTRPLALDLDRSERIAP